MANYYLDIETTGLDPLKSKIVTIQYQKLGMDGEPIEELNILKSWDSSEKEILIEFSKMITTNVWDFIAHGYNLKFEHDFFYERCKANGLEPIDILGRPHVDLHPIGIMMNGGNFKGSGLDKISGKQGNGMDFIEAYCHDDYEKAEAYIIREAREYIKLYCFLKKEMPVLLGKFREVL